MCLGFMAKTVEYADSEVLCTELRNHIMSLNMARVIVTMMTIGILVTTCLDLTAEVCDGNED